MSNDALPTLSKVTVDVCESTIAATGRRPCCLVRVRDGPENAGEARCCCGRWMGLDMSESGFCCIQVVELGPGVAL